MNNRLEILKQLISDFNYLKFIEKQSFSIDLIKALKEIVENWNQENSWNKISDDLIQLENPAKIANPYFVGFGNPESDILFIGQEKAFDIESENGKKLLFLESIFNNQQWKYIIEQNRPTSDFPLIFDPRFPQKYHQKKIKRGWHTHTWSKYANLISHYIQPPISPKQLFSEIENHSNSLFSFCFCTELNHIPSKRTKNKSLHPDRKDFLKHEFFKQFKYVVFAAGNSIKKEEGEIVFELFNAKPIEENFSLGEYGRKVIRNREISIYKSDKQTIITCAQLSGSAGWKNDHIRKMADLCE